MMINNGANIETSLLTLVLNAKLPSHYLVYLDRSFTDEVILETAGRINPGEICVGPEPELSTLLLISRTVGLH